MKKLGIAISAVLLLAGTTASADIFDTGGLYDATVTESPTNSWFVVTNQNGGDFGVVRLWGDNINDVITGVVVLNPVGAQTNNFAVNISNDPDDSRSPIGAVHDIRISSGANVRISLINIDGDLGVPGSFDKIEARSIQRIEIGGDCYSDIIANSTATQSSPTKVAIDGDWVSGSYANRSAALIDSIDVGGFVGSLSNPVKFWAASPISLIRTGGDFYGQIGENNIGVFGHPDIDELEIGGDFNGSASMTINSLDALFVGGDFDADVVVSTVMAGTSIYDIAGEFTSASSLTLPADGLVGQIIINSGNASDEWLGDVEIGSTTLANNYTALSDELGGGAVGPAPFNFHQRETGPGLFDYDCNPYQTETRTLGPSDTLQEVVINHYGPVYASGSNTHFRVEFKADFFGGTPTWVDVSDDFEVDTSNSGTSDATAQNNIVIKATSSNKTGFKASGRWRIRPESGRVKCGSVAGNPDVEYDSSVVSGNLGNTTSGTQYSWYAFRILQSVGSGMTVLEGGNGPTSADLGAWLNDPYETNADGETDIADFTDMANEYQGE